MGSSVTLTGTTIINSNSIINLTANTTYNVAWYFADNLNITKISSSETPSYLSFTTLSYLCFLEGSKILTIVDNKEFSLVEQYQNIENIKYGTLVKTYLHGYKKVTHIGKNTIHWREKYSTKNPIDKLYKLSMNNYDEIDEFGEDLYITGAHSILVNSLTKKQREETIKLLGDIYITDDKYRLMAYLDENAEVCDTLAEDPISEDTIYNLSKKLIFEDTPYNLSKKPISKTPISKKPISGGKGVEPPYTIWHIVLENSNIYENYGIYANGLLVESCSQWSFEEYSNLK